MSKAEVIQAYERYVQAFLADDLATIDSLVQYPLAYIGDGKVSVLDQWPFEPSALRAAKGWHTSIDMAYEVVGISETKAHVVLKRCTACVGTAARSRTSLRSMPGPGRTTAGRCSPSRTLRYRTEEAFQAVPKAGEEAWSKE